MTFIKYKASVSDTDLLINVAKAQRLDILENLFTEIVVPEYILDTEMLKKGKNERYHLVKYKRLNPGSPFIFKKKDENNTYKRIANQEYRKMIRYIDKGEAECCGYAKASGIKIIISDNRKDYEDMEQNGYIVLGHRDLLTLSAFFGIMSRKDAQSLYVLINNSLTRPSSYTFDETYDFSLKRMRDNGWSNVLGI